MATLKHIASKNADYNAAYRYLVFEHDEKTGRQIFDEQGYAVVREKYLIDGLLCTPDTFAMECRKLNKAFKKNQSERDIKTHHYIISYDPKDAELGLTIEQAQEMGMEYAQIHFPGHQAIVCTHPDGSNHSGNIHTHIVINSLRAQDTEKLPYKMRRCDTKAGYKHNSTREFLTFAQNGVVKMCLQHGLHQVDFEKSKKRITNQEYRAGRKGQERLDKENQKLRAEGKPVRQTKFETEKEKIRIAIESSIGLSQSREDFLRIMLEKYQITVKESRGRWSYLPPGRKQPIRGRMLGDDYEKEAVLKSIAMIEEKQNEAKNVQSNTLKPEKDKHPNPVISTKIPDIGEIGNLVDIEHNQKAKESEAYMQWAKIHNLQEQSKTFNYMSEHGLLYGSQLDEELKRLQTAYDQAKTEMKETEKQLREINRSLRLLGQYYQTKKVYQAYRKSSHKKNYREEHRSELTLYDAAVKELQLIYGDEKFPSIQDLKKVKIKLSSQKSEQYENYRAIRNQWMDVSRIVRNRDSFLKKQRSQERTESTEV